MLLCARFRRTCFNWLFICLIASTVLVYALLNALTYTSKPQQSQDTQDERVLPSDRQYAIVITDSSRNTQRPVSIASLRLLRKFRFEETTESFDNSDSENATDVDGNEDIGMEKKGTVIIRGNVEENVRREARRLHLRPPKRVRYSYGQWQIVDSGRQVYIYSAFYDNRPDIDWPQVRIIAVAESDVHLYGLCCLLWYRSQPLPDVAEISVVQVGPKISPRGQSLLEQFIFTCRLDTNKTDTPTSVSLVGPHSFRLSNLLPVHVPERPKHVIDVGHCISILYWKHDPFRLVEWLEANRMWGVGEINIYATAIDSVTDSILKRYSDTGFVKYRQSPGPLGDGYRDAIRLSMSPVINDCMYRNLYRYRYVMSTDIDEMIVPASPHHNYAEMLTAAAAAATRSNAVVHSFVFRNVYFFLDFGATEKEPWYLVTQRYTKHVPPSRYGYSSKSITRTLSCIGLQNHFCWHSLPSYVGQPNWNIAVPTDIGKSHHYKKCHFDKFLHKKRLCHRIVTTSNVTTDRAMFRFREKLANAVANKLLELDLVELAPDD